MQFITGKDIIKAKQRIDYYINKTPVFTSSWLNNRLGHHIYFKAEYLQKTGAFKVRGACNTIAACVESGQKPERIITVSSGNHAQATAWTAKQFNIPATVYLPVNSSKIKIQATAAYGAKIVLCNSRNDADEKVKEASLSNGTFFIPPFNHQDVIAGQGTAVYEAISEIGELDAVFAPCGGGGLLSGSLIATRTLSSRAEVIGAEPLNANDAVLSLRAGSIQKLQSVPDTIAEGAATPSVGDITFEYLKKLDNLYEVEETRIIYWTQWLSHLLKIRVEPTSAMAMEAAYKWLSPRKSKKKVLIVLSGGNIDQKTSLKIWNTNFLEYLPIF